MSAAIPILQASQPKVLSAAELDAHINDLTGLMELAYTFFVQTGYGSYRAEAARLLASRDAAILARYEATQGARQGRAPKQQGGRN